MNTTISTTNQGQTPPSGRRLALAVASWLVLSAVAGLATFAAAKAVAPDWAADVDNVAMLITTEVYAILVGSMLVVVGGGSRSESALGLRSVRRADILLALGAAGVAVVVSAIGYAALQVVAPADPSVVDVILGIGADGGRLADAGLWSTALIMLRILVLVPAGEELLFRGALFGWLRRRLSAWWTISITAIVFALIHQFLIVLPLAFLLGAALGWVRERTRSVIPGIVTHSVILLILVLVSFMATGWTARLPF
jgi:membrane protease YdiL (CAAX protease family)